MRVQLRACVFGIPEEKGGGDKKNGGDMVRAFVIPQRAQAARI